MTPEERRKAILAFQAGMACHALNGKRVMPIKDLIEVIQKAAMEAEKHGLATYDLGVVTEEEIREIYEIVYGEVGLPYE